MSQIFRPTEKQYYLLVDNHAFLRRAEELGYENVSPITEDMTCEEIQKLNKCVVRLLYDPEDPNEDGISERLPITGTDYCDIRFNFACYEGSDGGCVRTVEDALRYIPGPERLEKDLEARGLLPTTDYENRCGNCEEVLQEDDRYCPYCGTPRGEGAFDPFWNKMLCLYGPPTTAKYRCPACGHLWITRLLGTRQYEYCPRCGRTPLEIENCQCSWTIAAGIAEPFREKERPVLFTEAEIRRILDSRGTERNLLDDVRAEDAIAVLNKIGIQVAQETDRWLRTEKQAEQINLTMRMLKMKGNLMEGYPGVRCSHCGSRIVAAFRYEEGSTEENTSGPDEQCPLECPSEEEDLLWCEEGKMMDEPEWPAYICLRCGKRF